MVFSEMRPPVAADDGQTPLRGKHVGKLFDLAAGEYQDESGFRLTKEQICKNYTDDARMTDKNWNGRHHVTPSGFNRNNHKYYKVSPLSVLYVQNLTLYFVILAILRQRLQEQGRRPSAPPETARPI